MDSAVTTRLREYEDISDEYYDPRRHPTCANFRRLSLGFVDRFLSSQSRRFERCLEIGAGRSVLAELRRNGNNRLGFVTISDKSEKMLRHSRDLEAFYDRALLLDVESVPRSTSGFEQSDLVAASLADPYNTSSLWRFLSEAVVAGGTVVFTVPSYEWASTFRRHNQAGQYDVAEFVSRNGTVMYLPSFILTPDEQIALGHRFGFRIDRLEQAYCDAIADSELSPKLISVRAKRLPAVTGYVFIRE